MNTSYILVAIVGMAAVTFLLRALPFVVPKAFVEQPIARRVAEFMPLLIMVILVTHAFKSVGMMPSVQVSAVAVGIGVVALLQYLWRLPLLSIATGLIVHIYLLNG